MPPLTGSSLLSQRALVSSMAAQNAHSADRADRKAVLFCSACGHEAPYDGGWSLAPGGDRTDVECPRCGELVVSQPRFDASNAPGPVALVGPLLELLNALVRHDFV